MRIKKENYFQEVTNLSVLQEYKCPCCGGAVEFDSSIQKMKCPYCDSEFSVEALKNEESDSDAANAQDEMNWDCSAGQQWSDGETDGMKVYTCKSCGGEIVADETTGATHCPYCGNPVVMTGQFSGMLKPDYVIPFKLDKKAAKAALLKHVSSKRFVPKIFKDSNHIDEIKGVYVPFWLFDADSFADVDFTATRTRSWSDSNYDYLETSYFKVKRSGNVSFLNVPVDGSTKMPDDLMESIEPFKFNEAVDFQTAYLSGYLADKYDVDDRQSIERANERIKKSTEQAFAKTVQGYSSVLVNSSYVRLSNGKVKYALFPVWILNTSCNGENYVFAMNGQTGKIVGDVPGDKGRINLARVLFALGYTALAMIIMFFFYS